MEKNIKTLGISVGLALMILIFYFVFYVKGMNKELVKNQRKLAQAEKSFDTAIKKITESLANDEIYLDDRNIIQSLDSSLQEYSHMITEEKEKGNRVEDLMVGKEQILSLISNNTLVKEDEMDISLVTYSEDKLTRQSFEGYAFSRFTIPVRMNCYFSQLVSYLNYCTSKSYPTGIGALKISATNTEKVSVSFNLSWLIVDGEGKNKIEPTPGNLFDFRRNIARDIFLKKRDKVQVSLAVEPLLILEEIEEPQDQDGSFTVKWEAISAAEGYDLYVNNKVYRENAISPVVFRGLDDGQYLLKLLARYPGKIERESKESKVIVKIPPPELPELKGIVAIEKEIIALIDDRIFHENGYYNGFVISEIFEDSVHLLQESTGKTFVLKLIGPWSDYKGKGN